MIKFIQKIAVFIFFFSINFEMWDPLATNGHFSLSKLAGIIYFVVMLPSIMDFRTPAVFKPILGPIWIFFLWLTFISLVNIRIDNTGFIDFTILQNIVLFWILINHETIDELLLEKAMLCFGIGSIVLGILFSLGIGIDYDAISFRTSIFGDNANNVGVRMAISLIIIPLVLIQNRLRLGKSRYFFLLGLPFIFNSMIATGSRVSLIAFLLAYISFIFMHKSRNKWGKPVLILAGFFMIIYIWQVLLKSEVIVQRLIQSIQEGDLSERDTIWKMVIPFWLENPIFGFGETGYEYFTFSISGRYISPHNVILEILCLTGIVGLTLYLIFLYRITRISYQTYRHWGSLLSMLLLIPVFGLLLSVQLLQMKIGWVIFAYIVANAIYIPVEEDI